MAASCSGAKHPACQWLPGGTDGAGDYHTDSQSFSGGEQALASRKRYSTK